MFSNVGSISSGADSTGVGNGVTRDSSGELEVTIFTELGTPRVLDLPVGTSRAVTDE